MADGKAKAENAAKPGNCIHHPPLDSAFH